MYTLPVWVYAASYATFGMLVWCATELVCGRPTHDLWLSFGAAVSVSVWSFSVTLALIVAMGAPTLPM